MHVELGACGDASVAAAVYAIVDRAVAKRPDDDGTEPAELTVRGSLPDLQTLLVAPLTRGVPRSRAALARLADGRVSLEGPLGLGRALLRLLALP
jgi:hypothetical protein